MTTLGLMRHRLEFLRQTAGEDADGQPNGSWQTHRRGLLAAVAETAGTEIPKGLQLEANVTTLIELHAADARGITTADRVYLPADATNAARTLGISRIGDRSGAGRKILIQAHEIRS